MATAAQDSKPTGVRPDDGPLLLSAFRKVAEALGLTLSQQAAILGVSRATVAGWKSAPGNDGDKLDRMAQFVAIYGLAGQAFPGERGAEGWCLAVFTEAALAFLGAEQGAVVLEWDGTPSRRIA